MHEQRASGGRAQARRMMRRFTRGSTAAIEALERRRLLVAIASNERVLETIGVVGEDDTYEFDANAGDAISLVVGKTSGPGNFSPALQVLAPGGTPLNSFSVSFDAVNLAAPGTYSVVVRDGFNDATGGYALTMIRIPGAHAPEPDSGPIDSNQTRGGRLEVGDQDVFTFDANAGDAFGVVIGAPAGQANFSPRIRVFAPDGTALTNFVGSADQISLTQSGTYSILVRDSFDDAPGDYALTMVKVPGAQTPEIDSGTIASNEYRSGVLELGDVDVYTFEANAGDAFTAVVGTIGGVNFSARIRVFAPDGSALTNFVDAYDAVNVTQAGTYYVMVRDAFDDATGEYALTVVRIPAAHQLDDDSGPIDSNRRRLGTIALGDVDVYTFDASAGDAIELVVGRTEATANFSPVMRVFGPGGAPLSNFVSSFEQLNLAQGGTYTVTVRDSFQDATGPYSISLARFPAAQPADTLDDDGGALTSGQVVSGAIDAGDLDVYTTQLTAGAALTVRMTALAGAGFTSRVELYGPAGNRIGVDAGAPAEIVLASAPLTGTYYIVARESGDDALGTYSLAVNAATAADTRAPTVTQSRFLFDVPRQQIRLRLSESVAGTVNVSDLTLQNLTTAQTIAPGNMSATFNAPGNEIVFEFPGLPFRALPDGNYRATLNAGSVADAAGNPLGADASFEFYFLNGDANRDRVVNLRDFNILATNFGKSPRTFTRADFNYDGSVTLQDFNILAARFGMSVGPAATPGGGGAARQSIFGRSQINDGLEDLIA